VIQRYLTTRDEKAAARGIWTNAVLCVPASLLFFLLGTALFAYYGAHPHQLDPTLGEGDAILPWFIVTRLPAGVAGLVIAAVFAASMSSLDSSMNSVAAAVTTDFYRRFRPGAPERRCLALARWVTVLVGALGIALALMMAGWGIRSLWDQLATVIGLFASGLGGLFLAGILLRRPHGRGAVVGLLGTGLFQWWVKEGTDLSFLLYTFTGVAACVALTWLASLVLPDDGRDRRGLHLWDRRGPSA
jgi:Na+/proline symporter